MSRNISTLRAAFDRALERERKALGAWLRARAAVEDCRVGLHLAVSVETLTAEGDRTRDRLRELVSEHVTGLDAAALARPSTSSAAEAAETVAMLSRGGRGSPAVPLPSGGAGAEPPRDVDNTMPPVWTASRVAAVRAVGSGGAE